MLAEVIKNGSKTPLPGDDSISAAGLAEEVVQTYERLGGTQASPRLRPGHWDFAFDGWVLELDEENHFNRYRALTLDSPIYQDLDPLGLPDYREYCAIYEGKCRTDGGFWESKPTVREFGQASRPGILDGQGSPRWKQRAFYDYLKDLAPLTDGVAISRIAIWDTVRAEGETSSVDRILKRAATKNLQGTSWPAALLDLIESRLVRPA